MKNEMVDIYITLLFPNLNQFYLSVVDKSAQDQDRDRVRSLGKTFVQQKRTDGNRLITRSRNKRIF